MSDSLWEGLLEIALTMTPDAQPHTEYYTPFPLFQLQNWALVSNLTLSEDEVLVTQEFLGSIKLVNSGNTQLE